MAHQRFGVVGAGVVGLASAVQLQNAFPRARVTIIAEKFNEDTTSTGAGGIFRPTPGKTPGVPLDVFNMWLGDSWKYFCALVHSEDAAEAGCQLISGYEFYNSEQDTSLQKNSLYAHEKVQENELNIYPGPKYSVGYRGTTILTNPKFFMPYLMKQFKSKGGFIQQRKLLSLEELVGEFDVVVNCPGFGAREMVGDTKMYGIRGHLITVRAPWIKNYMYAEDGKGAVCHVYPRMTDVVIGGLRQTNDEDLTPRSEDRNLIWKQACVMVPSLKKAEIVGEWVGLRPTRKPLRVESEIMRFKHGELKVVHNYGHGGEGIGLSWGTSAHAVRLVTQLLSGVMSVSKY